MYCEAAGVVWTPVIGEGGAGVGAVAVVVAVVCVAWVVVCVAWVVVTDRARAQTAASRALRARSSPTGGGGTLGQATCLANAAAWPFGRSCWTVHQTAAPVANVSSFT